MATESIKASSKTEPWNKDRGMHPSDYVEELVELDYYLSDVPMDWGRQHFKENYTDEQIRKFWWFEIGRHNFFDEEGFTEPPE